MSKQSEHIFDGITHVDDDLVQTARVKKRRPWRALTAIAAALALIIGMVAWQPWRGGGSIDVISGTAPTALAKPVYPVMAAYPTDGNGDFEAWRADIMKQTDQPEGYADSLTGFFRESVREYLTGAGGENRAYSPVNVYMALAMLAETTDGGSRAQILDLLGSGGIEALRAQAKSVWNANYRDDGMTKSVLASSLWLRGGEEYNQQTVDALAQNYYASVFSGEMGSDAYNQMLQDWLNEQTGDLMKDQAGQEKFNSDTTLGLATTIYFRTKWADPFSKDLTEPGVFHAPNGDEDAEFMHRQEILTGYYRGERFGAIGLPLESEGMMWLILPDEGVTPEALLQDDDAMRFLAESKRDWPDSKTALVNLALPKFDMSSRFSLIDGLQTLGVKDVLDPTAADFSPVRDDSAGMYLSDANHAVRVAIDEEGIVAAAYTVIATGMGAPDPDILIDFVLDRPFLFSVTGHAGVPLFTGIVNTMG